MLRKTMNWFLSLIQNIMISRLLRQRNEAWNNSDILYEQVEEALRRKKFSLIDEALSAYEKRKIW